jgi:hypothetical protein
MKEAVLVFGGKKAKGTGLKERTVERPAVQDHIEKGSASQQTGKIGKPDHAAPAAAPADNGKPAAP